MVASYHGYTPVIEMLLKVGASLELRNINGQVRNFSLLLLLSLPPSLY
jgi:hypothetical protein